MLLQPELGRTRCPRAALPDRTAHEGFGDALPLVQLVHRAKGKPASCLDCGAEGLSPWGIAPSQGWGDRGQKRRGEQGPHAMEAEQPLWRCHGHPQYQGLLLRPPKMLLAPRS